MSVCAKGRQLNISFGQRTVTLENDLPPGRKQIWMCLAYKVFETKMSPSQVIHFKQISESDRLS